MSTKNEARKIGHGARAATHSFLTKEEFNQMKEEQGRISRELADINRKISSQRGSKIALNENKERIVKRWNELNEILEAAELSQRSRRIERLNRLGSMGIIDTLASAKKLIEDLQAQVGDVWTDEQREICKILRGLTSTDSPLLEMIHRSELDAGLAKAATEIARERAASQQAVGILKSQLRDMQDRRGKAALVLGRLYNERYEEVDAFRKARGVTHRIHLTPDDCKAVEDAIKG